MIRQRAEWLLAVLPVALSVATLVFLLDDRVPAAAVNLPLDGSSGRTGVQARNRASPESLR